MDTFWALLVGFAIGAIVVYAWSSVTQWLDEEKEAGAEVAHLDELLLELKIARNVAKCLEAHERAYHQPNATAKDCPCASPKKR